MNVPTMSNSTLMSSRLRDACMPENFMDFQLTKEQEFIRKMVREFATEEVEPLAADIDQEHRFPEETVEKMAKYGLLGVPFPTKYGGAGGDSVSYAITVEELSKKCASTGVICSAYTSLCC